MWEPIAVCLVVLGLIYLTGEVIMKIRRYSSKGSGEDWMPIENPSGIQATGRIPGGGKPSVTNIFVIPTSDGKYPHTLRVRMDSEENDEFWAEVSVDFDDFFSCFSAASRAYQMLKESRKDDSDET